MGNRTKSLFCPVLFNKFHHRTKLGVPPIQIPTYNGEMEVLFSEFHHKTNLTAPLLSNLGSKNKTTNPILKFVNLKVSYKFRILNAILISLVCNMMKVFLKIKPLISCNFSKNRLPKSTILVCRHFEFYQKSLSIIFLYFDS
jgi:hypothetical protein